MKNSPLRPARRARGVALVLVLCFIVLVTGLVVAYFSRAVATRQLSNASSSAEQAEILANSATELVVGDLKQEIADPNASVAFTPPPTALPAGSTVYVPTAAQYAVPQRNPLPSPGPATPPAPAVGPIPNLVRRSLRQDSTGGMNAAPAPAITSRASAASSSTASINGHAVSLARWNRHYLIPVSPAASPAPDVNASAPVSEFVAPDWVLVTRNGPAVETGVGSGTGALNDTTAANGNYVIGRYAYAIYDEGGLLDVNHTGFPSASTSAHIGAKLAPSYADLTQLPLSATNPQPMTSANVDNLLGWRNFATLQPPGQFPTFYSGNMPASADTAYYNLFSSTLYNVANPGPTAPPSAPAPSILKVPLTVWNNGTDQLFLSRQQLIGYFLAAGVDARYLQYLSTFSRSLNQPSYVPEATRKPVLPSASGGNNAGDDPTNPSTNITPNFLTARVVNAFTRYDGTPALVGEPLVKKRFPLNRLAWLTYKGPSATRSQTDPDMAALLANGITADFLNQGKEANVETYFGLQWTGKNWKYIHGSNGTSGAILNVNNPLKATDVARQSREPDFFELLKASINPGSLAKASLSSSVLSDNVSSTFSAQNQYKTDISLDAAILQIGANIIDQFDTDSFPTKIDYDLAGTGTIQSVYGDENLPYISRVRSGLIRLVEASPGECTTLATPQTPIVNTGVAAQMNYPEVWNPHDWSSDADKTQQSFGAVYPTKFKIFAETNANNGVQLPASIYASNTAGSYSCDASPPTDQLSPGFSSMYHFAFGSAGSMKGGEPRTLSETNTEMTFTVDPGSSTGQLLFREPTILYQTGYPAGSSLASTALVPSNGSLGELAQNPSFFPPPGAAGLISAVGSTGATNGNPSIPAAKHIYIGFYLGAHPLRWWVASTTNPNTTAQQTLYGPVNNVTYKLECEDGFGGDGWITYDNKPVTTTGSPNGKLYSGVDAGFGLNGVTSPGPSFLDFGVRFFETVDPRTSRFGMLDPWVQSAPYGIPPRGSYSFIDQTQGTLKTDREGVDSGSCIYFGPLANTPYGLNDYFFAGSGWYRSATMATDYSCHLGMLSQNNPLAPTDGYYAPVDARQPVGSNPGGAYAPFYYSDADGVVRRASGGNVPVGSSAPASTLNGLPMATALPAMNTAYSSGTTYRQIDARPVVLNRPFRSVGELGYVYSGTPWKNLDFFLPESGDAALLDVFCVNDNSDSNGLTAGQVNLNTQQVPVLQAILAQANKNLWIDTATTATTDPTITILGGASAQAQGMAQLLVTRTGTATGPTSGPNANKGPLPLLNVADLVGRWNKEVDLNGASGSNASGLFAGINGQASYDGFSADLTTYLASSDVDAKARTHNIQRYGESAIRALANAGQTRVWNLMLDLVAQTGRYPTQANTLDQFNVEGEQHYWVHLAIDRYTGRVIDKQVEVVKE